MFLRGILWVVGLASIIVWLAWRGQPKSIQRCHGDAMGCEWTLLYRNHDANPVEVQRDVQSILDQWENVMSTWRENSDLSRHNRGEEASADLQQVLALAEQLHKDTRGAFDHRLLEATHRANFAPEGKGFDLSGIGKGYAVDRVAAHLRIHGIHDFLFQLAGETIAGDAPWEVAIEAPDPMRKTIARKVILQNKALATSGNYRQFKRDGQQIVSHIIDPRTGKPVARPFCSVTVISDRAAIADAWATALFVTGEKLAAEGMEVFWQE